jgi:hypothetical protein
MLICNLLFTPMKQLSTRNLTLITLVAVAVFAIGIFVLQKSDTNPQSNSEYPSEYARLLAEKKAEGEKQYQTEEEQEAYEEMVEKQEQEEKNAIQELYTNADEKLKTGELVWYDIPELNVRFKVSPEVKDELVYENVTLSRGLEEGESGKMALVSFSTKTLESISESCSAGDGPVGVISRRVGTPTNPVAPCGGGYKVKEFPSGYFCYTHSQSSCTNTPEQYNEQVKPIVDKYNQLFTSEIFWNNVDIQ